MKKTVFCMAALALGASLFAQGGLRPSEGVEIHSGGGQKEGSEGGPAPITPSRSATLKGGQYLDISYPGTGWIYLGEISGSSLLRYEKREIGDGDTFFTLLAKGAGTTLLHFYKSDALAGNYIDDYLSVTISGTSRNAEHVEAPSYADIVPPRPSFTKSTAVAQAQQEKAQAAQASGPAGSGQQSVPQQSASIGYAPAAESGSSEDDRSATVIQTSGSPTGTSGTANSGTNKAATANARTAAPSSSEDPAGSSKKQDTSQLPEEEVLALARSAYEAKNYAESLSYLEDFFDKAVLLTDEGLFLKGRILESPSSVRNIKEALSSYKAIVSGYPESDLWEDASKRASYIQRIYFDIR